MDDRAVLAVVNTTATVTDRIRYSAGSEEVKLFLQNDPFELLGSRRLGPFGTTPMPMDAYRRGDDLWVHVDLPGVTQESLDISLERNVLSISADRTRHREEGDRTYLAERPSGTFKRQVHLGDHLDTESIEADFTAGVLTLRIPIAPEAKPRKVLVSSRRDAIDVESVESDP